MVLEAHEPGWGASGRNGGQVNPGLKHEPDAVERDYGPDLGARMVEFSGAAPALVFDLIARHSIRCEARRNGTLRAVLRPRQARKLDAVLEQSVRRGTPLQLLDRNQIAEATGTSRYVAGLLDRRGGDLNPLSFARGLARVAMAKGAAIHGDARVLSLSRADGQWCARTASGSVIAQRVVLATNGYTDDARRGYACGATDRTVVRESSSPPRSFPRKIARSVMPSRAALYETGTVTVYYRVDGGGRLLIGGRGPMREIAKAAAVPHLIGYAHALWPALRQVPWTPCLGRPSGDDHRSVPAYSRAGSRRHLVPRIQRPRSCVEHGDGCAARAKTVESIRALRHADQSDEDHPLSSVLARGGRSRDCAGPIYRHARNLIPSIISVELVQLVQIDDEIEALVGRQFRSRGKVVARVEIRNFGMQIVHRAFEHFPRYPFGVG